MDHDKVLVKFPLPSKNAVRADVIMVVMTLSRV